MLTSRSSFSPMPCALLWSSWARYRLFLFRSLSADIADDECDKALDVNDGLRCGTTRRSRKLLTMKPQGNADLAKIKGEFRQKALRLLATKQTDTVPGSSEAIDLTSGMSVLAMYRLEARDGKNPNIQREISGDDETAGNLISADVDQFPHQHLTKFDYTKNLGSNGLSAVSTEKTMVDRGFYMRSSLDRDEYEEGTAMDIPEVLQPGNKWKTRVKPQYEQFGSSQPLEVIDFHLPTQTQEDMESRVWGGGLEDGSCDWKVRYGSADPNVPRSNVKCPACGAFFHCQDQALPGFLPSDYFEEQSKFKFRECICRRCYMLKHHQFLLNVAVAPPDYDKLLSHLKTLEDVLCVLIVDMLDLEGSIYRQLPSLIGCGKPMVVVGNKVDLLPPDGMAGYLQRFRSSLKKAIRDVGFFNSMNIVHYQIISAKTGYGIEELISNIHTKWKSRGDVYLLGCTNAGKSTLFNRLLQSDLCKVRAVDLVERAATSLWPGTTLNLLRFPLMHMTPFRMVLRQRRLDAIRRSSDQDRRHRAMFHRGREPLLLQGYVGTTIEGPSTDLGRKRVPESETQLGFAGSEAEERQLKYQPRLTDPRFTEGFWCHDTPGTVNSSQIINQLTLDELILTIPKEVVIPRTFCMQTGQTLIVAGLARLELVESASQQVLMTVFASKELPVHVLMTSDVSAFMESHWNTDLIKVPIGSQNRWNNFPALQSQDLTLEGISLEESSGDVCLSSVGWVSVATEPEREVLLRASTPGGVGIRLRAPAMLPFAVMNRGRRIENSAAYSVLPLRAPKQMNGAESAMYRKPKNLKAKRMRKMLRSNMEQQEL